MEKSHEKTLNRTRNCIKFLCLFVFCFVLFSVASAASAASLYFSPSSGSYMVGSTFSVSVYVSSVDQAMNAASGVISFPQDKLEITSLSKTGSIFNLWVQEPSFSNSAGTINFEGIVLNPGFTGASGKIITVNFKVKSGGNALLSINSGSVLANDGQGTNILAAAGQASFALEITPSDLGAPQATTPAESIGTPPAPQIFSSSHPNPNQWYSQTQGHFFWTVPAGVTASKILLNNLAQSVPTIINTPAISSTDFEKIEQGVWYLHVQFKNQKGWGGIAHYKIQIDTEPPSAFSIKFDEKDKDTPQPTIILDAKDSLSGLDHYKIRILQEEPIEIKTDTFTLPPQTPGQKTIIVKAFDKAGNFSTAVEDFIVKALEAPYFTSYPKQIGTNEFLEVKGKALPNAEITVWLIKENGSAESSIVKSDAEGNFIFVADKRLDEGVYQMWAEAKAENGAISNPSERIILRAVLPFQLQIGKIIIDNISIINTLVIIILGLFLLSFYTWYRVMLWKASIKKEEKEMEKKLKEAFLALSQDVKKQISKIDGSAELSSREESIYLELKRAIDSSEKIIGTELQNIMEKELKKSFLKSLLFWKR